MARKKTLSRVVRAIADTMWERDRLQMGAVDALLSTGAPSDDAEERPGAAVTRAVDGTPDGRLATVETVDRLSISAVPSRFL